MDWCDRLSDVWRASHPGGVIVWVQLSVAHTSFVWDDWGGNHWFPFNRAE